MLQSGARWLYPVKKAEESSYALSIVERGGLVVRDVLAIAGHGSGPPFLACDLGAELSGGAQPVIQDSGTSDDTRTCFAIQMTSADDTPTDFQILKSTNSGSTWATDGGSLSVATYGYPLWMIADDTAIYIATKTDLIRRPTSGGSWTKATGTDFNLFSSWLLSSAE